MTAPFACVSTAVLSPKVIKVIKTSPLTLLVYLHQLTDYRTGKRTRPYAHAAAAAELGISERTVRTYFAALRKAELITARRLDHGVDFAFAHPDAERQESAVQPPPERKEVAVHEGQESAVQPSRGKNRDSESTNQNPYRGGRTMVGGQPPAAQPAALTPPDPEIELALQDARGVLGHDLTDEVQKTLRSALRQRHIPPGRRREAAAAVADSFARNQGRWSDNASYWGKRLLAWSPGSTRPKRVTGIAAVDAVFDRHGVPAAPGIDEEMRRVALR